MLTKCWSDYLEGLAYRNTLEGNIKAVSRH